MHLQEHMQRVEMQIQTREEENLAVLFFDPVCEKTDKHLRDIYFDLFNSGDFINSYKHIKDSLNIEHSHQSVGIQLADFISGAFSSILKGLKSDNYEMGKTIEDFEQELGYPRGWTDVSGATEDERLRAIRTEISYDGIDHILLKYLGKNRFGDTVHD